MNRKKIITTIYILLLLILTFIVLSSFSKFDINIFYKYWWLSLILIFLSFFFLFIKSSMLYFTGKLFLLPYNFYYYFKLFSISCFVELTTFSGKLGSDGFKYVFLKEISIKKRITFLIFLRSSDITAFIILIYFLVSNSLYWFNLILIIFVIIYLLFYLFYKPKKINDVVLVWLILLIMSVFSFFLMGLQYALIFDKLGLNFQMSNIKIFLLSHGLGVLSQIPMGIGIKDYSIFYQLKEIMPPHTIIFGILWTRVFSEITSAIVGSYFSWKELKKD